jgi:rSAM/selenodomain-associated transferase 1
VTAVLAVFLKAPRSGAVKTRLVPALGPDAAAQLYRALAERVLAATRPSTSEYERRLFFAPPEAGAEMEAWRPGEAWIPQAGADLGARMSSAFDGEFRRGADRVAIVGSDVPGLSRADVLSALESLEDHDLAVGPARDGGYYLIALAQRRPELFRGIAWGTGAVFGATMERAAALGLTVRVLEERRDIDTPDDVRAEWASLRPLLTRGVADAIENALGLPPPS